MKCGECEIKARSPSTLVTIARKPERGRRNAAHLLVEKLRRDVRPVRPADRAVLGE